METIRIKYSVASTPSRSNILLRTCLYKLSKIIKIRINGVILYTEYIPTIIALNSLLLKISLLRARSSTILKYKQLSVKRKLCLNNPSSVQFSSKIYDTHFGKFFINFSQNWDIFGITVRTQVGVCSQGGRLTYMHTMKDID